MNFFLNLLGTGGVIVVIAFILDTLLKLFNKKGIFEDLGLMAAKAGKGIGQGIGAMIPGNKVEPELDEWIDKLQKVGNVFVDNVQEGLGDTSQDTEKTE